MWRLLGGMLAAVSDSAERTLVHALWSSGVLFSTSAEHIIEASTVVLKCFELILFTREIKSV